MRVYSVLIIRFFNGSVRHWGSYADGSQKERALFVKITQHVLIKHERIPNLETIGLQFAYIRKMTSKLEAEVFN